MINNFIANLRSVLFYLGYVSLTILLSTLLLLCSPFLSDLKIYRAAGIWCKGVLLWLELCCGVKHEIRGLENLPETPCVIVSNHQSSWETLLFYQLIFPVSPILKKELLKIPFFGWALNLANPIAIDRSKPREAARSLLIQGKDRLERGFFIILFPEGKRSAGEIAKFSRSGAKLAITAEVPVVPISHNAGICWPAHRFTKFPGVIQINIGPPVQSNGRNDGEFMDEVRKWIVLNRPS